MSKDLIRYDLLVQDALKGVVRKVLGDVIRDGLPGEHHFYISFKTGFPGVRLSQRLRDKYPDQMTIVLQHQFWDLGVTEHAFEVGLSFSSVPERLLIPFDALTGFYDPSVQFGLKFEVQEEESDEAAPPALSPVPASLPAPSEPVELQTKRPALPAAPKPALPAQAAAPETGDEAVGKAATPEGGDEGAGREEEAGDKPDAPASGAEVVSLDAFRKKS